MGRIGNRRQGKNINQLEIGNQKDVITIKADKKASCIAHIVNVYQSLEFCKQEKIKCYGKSAMALWDTGAGRSGISKKLAEELRLMPIKNGDDHVKIDGSAGEYMPNFYYLDISLSKNIKIHNIKVSDFADNKNFDVLLGMDIITMGDFALTNDNGNTVFSFRIPTNNKPICFEL
jgi:hypothetical protein